MAELPYEDKAKCILENRKNANMLVDLLEKLDSNSKSELLEVISCLEKVFKGYFFQRLWQEQFETDDAGLYVPGDSSKMIHAIYHGKQDKDQALQNEKKEEKSQKNVERIFAEWAHKQYLNFVKELLQLCSHQDKNVQKSALESLMSFVVSDHNAAISSPMYDPKQSYFPGTLFSRIMDSVLFCEPHASDTLLNHFEQHYLKFIDIQFYTLKNILRVANGKSKSIAKNENVKNHLCALLLNMSAPKEEDDEFQGFVIDDVDRLQCISPNSKERKKLFSNTWLSLLRLKLPTQSLKKVLANLHENVMPQMEDPKLLIDFLTDCYDLEGPIALLALNGLFLLIQNYNLDYPDFFKKLYNLLDADIFGVKYRDRFCALADLFLTSLNLPAYMAAAFVKRLARISLRVSPDGIRIILVMIENLIKRHPSCKVLIHRKVSFHLYHFSS